MTNHEELIHESASILQRFTLTDVLHMLDGRRAGGRAGGQADRPSIIELLLPQLYVIHCIEVEYIENHLFHKNVDVLYCRHLASLPFCPVAVPAIFKDP